MAANRWHVHEHIGTQIDAPSHFDADGRDMASFGPEELVAPLVIVDIRSAAAVNSDATVTVETIREWEREHGLIPPRAAVFMLSGWAAKVTDEAALTGVDSDGTMHFPGFSPEAARFLWLARDAVALGVDTLSIDPGSDSAFQSHKVWLGAGRWAAELVAELDKLPATGATVVAAPVKVRGATGSPSRLFAIY